MTVNTEKVPSQVFRWFEKMKNNYEQSIQQVLNRFENHTYNQQERIDNAYAENIHSLRHINESQQTQNNARIHDLQQDIIFFKSQITLQQKTIEQLNTRYDAVMKCLLAGNPLTPHAYFADHEKIISEIDAEFNVKLSDISESNSEIEDINDIFEQAITDRDNKNTEQAFSLFQQAAEQGHSKAMGAMGRCYFLGEGCDSNPVIGLAWLINAAEAGLPQAINRVEQFKQEDEDIYTQAKSYQQNNLLT